MVVEIQIKVFSDVTPCSVVVGYQHSGRPCCLHLQCEVSVHVMCRPNFTDIPNNNV